MKLSSTYVTRALICGTGLFLISLVNASSIYPVGSTPKYLIVIDLNQDGISDIVTANFNSNNISVLMGRSDGTFAPAVNYAVGVNPTSLAPADFNGDGKMDLATANVNNNCPTCTGSVSLLLGNGDGTFQQPAVSVAVDGTSAAVAAAHLNMDRLADLVVGDTTQLFVLLGRGNGTFLTPAAYATGEVPHNIVVWDFNMDGKPDTVSANYNSNNVSVLLGAGSGDFRPAVNYPVGTKPHEVVLADLNGDNLLDLITANQNSNNISVLLSNGDGTFQPAVNYPSSPNPSSIATGDFNGDGRTDLAISNSGCLSGVTCTFGGTDVTVLLNMGNGVFQAAGTYVLGSGAAAIRSGDFDRDGKLDLAIGCLANNSVIVLFGNGDGTFR